MFLGDYYPRMDDKGRLALPAKFRDKLVDGMVVARGHDRCLFVYPMADFEILSERVKLAPSTNPEVRSFERNTFATADAQAADKQGRIVIKPALRAYAGLDRECAVLGVNDRVEIWDAEAWRKFSEEQEQGFVNFSGDFLLPG